MRIGQKIMKKLTSLFLSLTLSVPSVFGAVRPLTRTGAIVFQQGESTLAGGAIDSANQLAYFSCMATPGKLVKVSLSPNLQRTAVWTTDPGEAFADAVVIDSAGQYAYVAVNQPHPQQVVKVRLSDMSRVGSVHMPDEVTQLRCAVIDDVHHYAYFGSYTYTGYNPGPGQIIRVDLNNFTDAGVQMITLPVGEVVLASAIIDVPHQFAYFGTTTQPAKIVKIDLQTFTEVLPALTLRNNFGFALSAVIDVSNQRAYFGSADSPARVAKVNLATFTEDPASPITMVTGEDRFQAAAIDTNNGYAYFGTEFDNTGHIVRINLSNFTRDSSLATQSGEESFYPAVFDPVGGFAYFGTQNAFPETNPGHVVKYQVADPIPLNLTISNISAMNITSNQASITWNTNKSADSQVDWGLTNAYGNTTTLDTSMVLNHNVALTGLSLSTTYHYRVKSRDSGGTLVTSGDNTFTTLATVDTTAPTISNVSAGSPTTTAANITWLTDENSDTQVEYGLTAGYGSQTTLNPSMVLSHSVNLTGLTASTVYHYRVKSRDPSGNLATSTDFTFTTATPVDNTPPVLSSITSSNITTTGATVTWNTNENSDTQVEYGTSVSYGSQTTLNTTMTTSHSAALSGLASSTTYHYRVKSRDAAGNLATSGDFTFTTAAVPDTTPPTISNVVSNNITNAGATISWNTNENSDSQVEYGLTVSYGSQTSLNTTMSMAHGAGLTGLQPSTLYHYRVKSKDAAGNLATSGDSSFTTTATPDTAPPVIGGISSSNIAITAATIHWTTDEASDGQVEYGLSTTYGIQTSINTILTTDHTFNLTGLSPNTVYHYRVKSKDAASNSSVSTDRTFTTQTNPTPPPTPTPVGQTSSETEFLSFKNIFNPSIETLRVRYHLSPSAGPNVHLAVYGRMGEEIKVLDRGSASGSNDFSTIWDGRNDSEIVVAAGTYILVLKTDEKIVERKVILVK